MSENVFADAWRIKCHKKQNTWCNNCFLTNARHTMKNCKLPETGLSKAGKSFWRKLLVMIKNLNLNLELTKEEVLDIIISKYGSLIMQ